MQVATPAMVATAREMLAYATPPSREFINFSIRISHKATHAQADDAIRAARHNPTARD